ncbi:MAG: patatin-like phospholipase family protein [Tannerella sp.]|jgi:patatin-like phospholipase/acyl hydrolase|nr:patatin-like phospholipase family protein [Tannerella sp.]
MSKYFRILALDGGGIRGMLPAMIVAELERRLRKATNNADSYISDYFDLIAGTSTGGILSCIYLYNHNGRRIEAADAASFYENFGSTIFRRNCFSFIIRLFDSLYRDKGINGVLDRIFGEAKLSEAVCNCAIMAYDISERKAVIFTRDAARQDDRRDYRLRDIARATSAAPTYFRVAKALSISGDTSYLIDGGIYANDPSICGIVEAKKTVFGAQDTYPKISDMLVVSIGTGKVVKSYDYERARKWGVISWAIPVIDMLQSSSAEVVSYQVDKLFDSEGSRDQYIRIVPELYDVSHKMDDASPQNIACIKEAGNIYIANNDRQLDEIVKLLIK